MELLMTETSMVFGTKIAGKIKPMEHPKLAEIIPTMVEYILSCFGKQFADNFDSLM